MSTIDRDMLIKKYINPDIEKFHNSDVKIVLENLKQNILKMPTADRPQGKWIRISSLYSLDRTYRCSVCGKVIDAMPTDEYFDPAYKGCPYCLTRMKGADDE